MSAQQHDRRLRGGENVLFERRRFAFRTDRCDAFEHHGKRLFLAMLALAQAAHRRVVARIKDEMKSSQPFHRDDRTIADRPGRAEQSGMPGAERFSTRIPKGKLRPAFRTRIWLRVEAAVA